MPCLFSRRRLQSLAMTSQQYQEALDYIYSFVDYSVKRSYRYSAEVFDLGRVQELQEALGNPQDQFGSVHVAGTKGKGSVAVLTASALQAAGYRTGLYTSPHLQRFTERIQVNGEEISHEAVARLVGKLKPHVARIKGLTTYELITALGFLHFAEQNVDYASVEVGLGGRLDATTVIRPLVSVITSLSYDHMHLLGDSLSEIAQEKSGIIKEGVPVVLAPQQREAELVVMEAARAKNSPVIRVGSDWLFAPGTHDLDHQSLFIWSVGEQALVDAYVESGGQEEWVPPRYEIPLLGYHQVVNAAVSYAAIQVLRQSGVEMSETAIWEGFRQAKWPGRFQVLAISPTVVVDSAHNRDSALKLRIALEDYFPSQPVTLVFGASTDKDIAGMFAELLPRVSRLIVTQAVHPRAADAEGLAEAGRGYGVLVKKIVPVADALEHALEIARPGEVILAAGSVFVVGEILTAWEEMTNESIREAENTP